MTYADYIREPFVPFEVLDRLTAAGLGDIPQYRIGRDQFEAAMQLRPVTPGRDRGNVRATGRRLAYLQRKAADPASLAQHLDSRRARS